MPNITKDNYPGILDEYIYAFSFSDLIAFMEFINENDFEPKEGHWIILQLLKQAYRHSLLKTEMLERQHLGNRESIMDIQKEIERLDEKIDLLN